MNYSLHSVVSSDNEDVIYRISSVSF